MEKIFVFKDEEFGDIYIQAKSISGDDWEEISNFDTLKGKFQDALNSVKAVGKSVIAVAKEMDFDELEVKTGVKFAFKEGKLISYIAQGEVEIPIEVTFKWKRQNT